MTGPIPWPLGVFDQMHMAQNAAAGGAQTRRATAAHLQGGRQHDAGGGAEGGAEGPKRAPRLAAGAAGRAPRCLRCQSPVLSDGSKIMRVFNCLSCATAFVALESYRSFDQTDQYFCLVISI